MVTLKIIALILGLIAQINSVQIDNGDLSLIINLNEDGSAAINLNLGNSLSGVTLLS